MTDMTSVLTALSGYWTAAEAIGVGVVLFVVGRRLVNAMADKPYVEGPSPDDEYDWDD